MLLDPAAGVPVAWLAIVLLLHPAKFQGDEGGQLAVEPILGGMDAIERTNEAT
jgi:hypothetical protein